MLGAMIGSAQRLPGHLASGTGSTLRPGWDQARPRALDVVYPGSSIETSTGAYRLWSLCPQWHHNEGDPRHPFVGGRVWDEGVKWTGVLQLSARAGERFFYLFQKSCASLSISAAH